MTAPPDAPASVDPELFRDDAALGAASITACGWPVIPLRDGTDAKKPRPVRVAPDGRVLPTHGNGANHRDLWATTPHEVAALAQGWAEGSQLQSVCGFGVITGTSTTGGPVLAIIDVDGDLKALHSLLDQAGPAAWEWADQTLRVQRGEPTRMHLYGVVDADDCPATAHLAPALEWRGVGGYVCAPGSPHPGGGRYRMVQGGTVTTPGEHPPHSLFDGIDNPTPGSGPMVRWRRVLPVPAELLQVVAHRLGAVTAAACDDLAAPQESPGQPGNDLVHDALPARLDGLCRAVLEAPEGQGNDRLNWAAGVAGGLLADAPLRDQRAAREALVEAFLGRPIPAGEDSSSRAREARATVASGFRWGTQHPDEARGDHRRREAAAPAPASAEAEGEALAVEVSDGAEHEHLTGTTALDPGAYHAFWAARPLLAHVRAYARARRISAWALLGVVLARASCAVSPAVVLPPTRGTVASLNVFVGLCGGSGGNKSVTMGAARELLADQGGTRFLEALPGSGEGITAGYTYTVRPKPKKGETGTVGDEPTRVRVEVSMLFNVDEVQQLDALMKRTASTLLPTLKTAWSGGPLGNANASAETTRHLDAHSYRLCMVAGVQPAHAGAILDDAAGGFPQRWLWMPTYAADLPQPGEVVEDPGPWSWEVSASGVPAAGVVHGRLQTNMAPGELLVMELPRVAVVAIHEAQARENRPIGSVDRGGHGLDGHSLLSRTKVAAIFALLDDRLVVSDEDWHLAGVVMAVSDTTRERVIGVRNRAAAAEADQKAVRRGRSDALAATAAADTNAARVMGVLRRKLQRRADEAPSDPWVARSQLRRAADSKDRPHVNDALDRLVESGEVVEEPTESRGSRLRLTTAGGAK